MIKNKDLQVGTRITYYPVVGASGIAVGTILSRRTSSGVTFITASSELTNGTAIFTICPADVISIDQPAPKDVTPLVIRFCVSLNGRNVYRFAQNRSKTFDASSTVCKREDAKVFPNRDAAFRFLSKLGLARRDAASGEYSKVTNLDSPLNYSQLLNVDEAAI